MLGERLGHFKQRVRLHLFGLVRRRLHSEQLFLLGGNQALVFLVVLARRSYEFDHIIYLSLS